ncbi:hypothetical protein CC78DRAFT_248232 [Lojkania enalia]|uniref:Uncharacterized protein n=1 Tax=Lojkania enalia TaxID=147567 RepID=A0A9P4KCV9_9PLEO|nr:hypothetical protein CC78DRAFT_248232 [Didymosphaeria enalia]
MSDYGEDDISDYGEDWFYVEDEYMPADDLAEHAVNSPPPATYLDDENEEDWDRFEYYNDLEYGSDGYDDVSLYLHNSTPAKTGQKRKRGASAATSNKKQKVGRGRVNSINTSQAVLTPVVWRSRSEPPKPKVSNGSAKPVALFKDWRNSLADTPVWASGPLPESGIAEESSPDGKKATIISKPLSPLSEDVDEEEAENAEGEGGEIDSSALIEALQKNLAAAGGPLQGMDPQQLLQFAMRMIVDKDAGDDIAGELADSVLQQGAEGAEGEEDDEDDEEAPADILSWLSKQRETSHEKSMDQDVEVQNVPKSSKTGHGSNRPPTPPSSETYRSVKAADYTIKGFNLTQNKNSASFKQNSKALPSAQRKAMRKRKAEEDTAGDAGPEDNTKKRATRSYDAPTAASLARAGPSARTTRSGRVQRS